MNDQIEIVRLSKDQARDLTDRIKTMLSDTWSLIMDAYKLRVWESLGYESWDAYCTTEFPSARLRLPKEERRTAVLSMREEAGMSSRAIASATGMHHSTVAEDIKIASIQQEQIDSSNDSPGEASADPPPLKVVGLDGKTYAPKPAQRKIEPELKISVPAPVAPQFENAAEQYDALLEKMMKLKKETFWRGARHDIADECIPSFRRTVEFLQDFMDELTEDNE